MNRHPLLGKPSMVLERSVVLLCAVLLGSGCAAPASRTAAEPAGEGDGSAVGHELASAQAAPVIAEEDDPIVCRRMAPTGTRVAEKVCLRRSQIEKSERDAAEMLGEVQRRGAIQIQKQQ